MSKTRISHRLAAKSNSHAGALRNDPAIIVKFIRREVRDKFYTSRKYLRGKSTKDIGLTKVAEHRKIYIGESLTQQNRKLSNLCLAWPEITDMIYSTSFVICTSR